ncbi:hypothetical protein HDE_06994 [Halotydeus destructor]|nr:hypothetical protein HDE_06994 [Halotydeus destructor]
MTENQSENWVVDCSDDESLRASGISGETSDKSKVWEPSGPKIAFLYKQLEKMGAIDLKWQCPGRRSPSVHSPASGERKFMDTSEQPKASSEPNEFDFDEDFDDLSSNKITTLRRKSIGQQPKRVAKLDNVMKDIKKYHSLEQAPRKSTD